MILLRILLVFLLAASAAGKEPSFDEVNTACGVSLFMDENLWDDEATAVAARLGWPLESETSRDSSYRLYPAAEARFLGARPFSQVLYAEKGKPSGLSLVFANKGDAVERVRGTLENRDVAKRRRELRENRKAIEVDNATLEQTLTALLGPPSTARLGDSRETREKAQRWDWKGHTFFLAAPDGEYVALRIVPSDAADSPGGRVPDAVMKKLLLSRVERRANGDVILRDMPMVDQGPKGYCVPATWERVMRYMGIPADMYVLAMAGGTNPGGGTKSHDIAWAVRDAVVAAGRRIERPSVKLTPSGVARFIDAGLPLMWAMYTTDEFNAAVDGRRQARQEMSDTKAWTAALAPARKAAKQWVKDSTAGHICMVIGYNETTGELAVSDSWGPEFAERWVTPEEAEAISQNGFYVIQP